MLKDKMIKKKKKHEFKKGGETKLTYANLLKLD